MRDIVKAYIYENTLLCFGLSVVLTIIIPIIYFIIHIFFNISFEYFYLCWNISIILLILSFITLNIISDWTEQWELYCLSNKSNNNHNKE